MTKTFEFKCVRYVVIMWFTSYGPYIIRRDSYWHRSVRTKHRKAEKNIYNDFYGAQVFFIYLFEEKKSERKNQQFRQIFLLKGEKKIAKNTVMLSEVKIKNCTSGW